MNIFEGLDVGGPSFFRNDVTAFGALNVGGVLGVTGALTVTGVTTLNGGLAVTGAITFSGTWDGWIGANETWTYASATTFTISGDVTSKYQIGDKLKLTQTTAKYFFIGAISYSAPNTTITVVTSTSYTLANAAITSPFYSKIECPQGFPHWHAYTPTIAGFGTAANVGFIFGISGGELKIFGKWQSGTVAGSTASITVPGGLTLNYGILSTFQNIIGEWVHSKTENISANDDHGALATDGSDTGKVFFSRTGSTGNALPKENGNSISSNTNYVLVKIEIPLN